MPSESVVVLSRQDLEELEIRQRSRTARADDVRRPRMILMLADGESLDTLQGEVGLQPDLHHALEGSLRDGWAGGPYPRYRGRKAAALTPAMEARILAAAKKKKQAH